jgi:xanthine/CO dehydrogenase XdhC/CoxF family maturation factor
VRVDALLARVPPDVPSVLVTVLQVEGSAPREPGASLLVTAGDVVGSIGGGRLEHAAIARAHAMLEAGGDDAVVERHALGPGLGQCCGGAVTLRTAPLGADAKASAWYRALVRGAHARRGGGAGHDRRERARRSPRRNASRGDRRRRPTAVRARGRDRRRRTRAPRVAGRRRGARPHRRVPGRADRARPRRASRRRLRRGPRGTCAGADPRDAAGPGGLGRFARGGVPQPAAGRRRLPGYARAGGRGRRRAAGRAASSC